jgi:hypothetical protein
MTSVERLAVHPARIRTEIPRGKLPAERAEAWVDLDAGLFETPLQLFDDIVHIVFLPSVSVYEETGTRPNAWLVRMDVGNRLEGRFQSVFQFLEFMGRKESRME